MRRAATSGCYHGRRRGVTLLELLIVITIIAVLVMLSFPAIQYSREMSRRVACQGNLHQLGVAMTHFIETRKELPAPAPQGKIGGWAIAILPFMEESVLSDRLSGNPPLDSMPHRALARERPVIMTCPSRHDPDDGDVQPSHYVASFTRKGKPKFGWTFGEIRTGTAVEWIASPERPMFASAPPGPHRGGGNSIRGHGANAYGVDFEPAD